MCECKPEHTGKNCRLNVQSICLNSNPCKNNGTCIPGLNNGIPFQQFYQVVLFVTNPFNSRI